MEAGWFVLKNRVMLCFIVLLLAPLASAHGGGHDGGSGSGTEGRADSGGNRTADGSQGNQTPGDSGHGEQERDAEAHRRCMQQRDDGAEHDHDSPQGNGTATQGIQLAGTNGTVPTLHWTPRGLGSVCSYKVYRSDELGNTHLVGVVRGDQTSYSDTSATSGVWRYFVLGVGMNNQNMVSSNSVYSSQAMSASSVSQSCNWGSVSPFGNPPVLLNPECL